MAHARTHASTSIDASTSTFTSTSTIAQTYINIPTPKHKCWYLAAYSEIDNTAYLYKDGYFVKVRIRRPLRPLSLFMDNRETVYLLQSTTRPKLTYIGYTVDIHRRIREHNGEVANRGAKATRRGRPWKVVATVKGFPNNTMALIFEWRNHHPPTRRSGLAGRIQTMAEILSMDRWTSNDTICPQSLQLTVTWWQPHKLPFCPPNVTELYKD